MKNLSLLLLALLIIQASIIAQQIITEQSHEPVFFKVTSHDPNFKNIPEKSFYESKADWQYIIDTTWGPGLPLAQKQQIFNAYVSKLEEKFDGFESLGFTPATWDAFKTHNYSKIDTTTSRGRFSAIMSHLSLALRDLHTYAYDDVVLNTPLNPKVPLLILGGWFSVDHFGAVLTCLPDSSILVLRVVENHPLNLEPGDIILGYDGVKWKDILVELLEAELPILPNGGGSASSYRDALFLSAGMNWHLFDTIDILKQSAGDTLHLSVLPLLNLNAPLMLNNEQLEIPNIPFPNKWNGELVTYGILPNSNIGYIYVFSEWPTSLAEQQFYQAISALQNTDGLIVDLRWNEGGWALWNDAFSILSNEIKYSLNDALRCAQNNWTLCPTGDSVSYPLMGNPPDKYDRTIAVLLGPTCVSMGDVNAYRLTYLSTVRTFGKSSAASLGWNEFITNFTDWTLRYSFGDMYHLKQAGSYLNRKEFPVNYPVWFNPDDVAQGKDAVVESALNWMNNLVYGHDVVTDNQYYSPGNDTVNIAVTIENPNSHNVTAQIFIRNLEDTFIDSLELFPTGEEDIWDGNWLSASYEDIFKLEIKATDQTTGESFSIENVNRFTTAGPVVLDSLKVTRVDSNTIVLHEIYITNRSGSITINGIQVKPISIDSCATTNSGIKHLGNLNPGETRILFGTISFNIFSCSSDSVTLAMEIYSGGIPYWESRFKVEIPIVGIEDIAEGLPTEYSLSQSYPNPFNPSTTIKYEIKELTNVELKVFDILGREMMSLINEEKPAGRYEIVFDASQLSSGVYFYRLQVYAPGRAGNFVETKKMVLLR